MSQASIPFWNSLKSEIAPRKRMSSTTTAFWTHFWSTFPSPTPRSRTPTISFVLSVTKREKHPGRGTFSSRFSA